MLFPFMVPVALSAGPAKSKISICSSREVSMRSNSGMPDRIRVRVYSDEKAAMLEAAAKRGLNLSDFIRQIASEAVRATA